MNKRMLWILVIIMVFPLIASACGGDDVSAEDAEKAVRAGLEGNFEEANKYICDEQKIDTDAVGEMPDQIDISDISCEKDGDKMKCSVKASVSMGEDTEPADLSQDVTFAIKDGKLCEETPSN